MPKRENIITQVTDHDSGMYHHSIIHYGQSMINIQLKSFQ